MAAQGLLPEDLEDPAQRLLCGEALLCVYENSNVPEQDRLGLLQRAAQQGEPNACLMLSQMYGSGDGAPQDEAQALAWLHRSAACGGSEAAFLLASRYESGDGVEKNMQQAAAYYRQA